MTASDPLAAILARLEQGGFEPRESGPGSWESRCPAHNGSRKNLSVKRGDDGRSLVYCHHQPGCDPAAIVGALGMTMADLFPGDSADIRTGRNCKAASVKSPRRAHPSPELALARLIKEHGEPTTWWPYHDAEGFESFRVYRFDFPNSNGEPAKKYRPVHTMPEGWVLGDPPGPLPLYRLPELAGAARVFVTEGEKTSEVAHDLGVVATTSAHGAKSAHKTDWSPFAGKEVIILPDHDSEGERYADEICAILSRLDPRPRVRIVRLKNLWRTTAEIPEGGDLEQWLSEGVLEGWTDEECRADLERRAIEAPEVDLDTVKSAVSSPRSTQTPPRRANLVCFSDITEEKWEWLWYPRLPLGTTILFAGAPKVGKTFVTLGIAAAVSRGSPLPLDDPRTAGSVIILSAEDDPAKTLKPRLRACGANMKKVHFLKSVLLEDESETLPSLRADLEAIESAAKGLRDTKAIIIDPVSAYLDGVDDHKYAEIRSLLFPLDHMARRLNAAIILVTHLNKSSARNAQQRVSGSIGYVAACRMNFLFAKDKDDPANRRRLMLDNGCNITVEVPTLGYRIADSGEGAQVEWEQEPIAITADEAMTEQPPETTDENTEVGECRGWLKDALSKGPVPAEEVIAKGKAVGFSEKTMRRAKKLLDAKSERSGFHDEAAWKWVLPSKEGAFEDGQRAP